ncbi:hypothetical protein JRO89_XS03G0214100 [Xanthoceras sorbifolium]|uniref:Retrovirus-related Pol polyprotein from transposon RE1 n=1 Tax=Xanthoceras sorbifolium TaxID=99658 RepID=A0ABQ8IB13_9ROSI|nr:hypothetical protein JRO89_XS03G0214100 [Xanthoceras sorbifolium]
MITTPTITPTPPTTNENQLLTINTLVHAPLKRISSNHLLWKVQFEMLFIGYDLLGYIVGSKLCPPKTVTTNNIAIPNPAYNLWVRQDQLILNALIGSLSPILISFITRATTSREAWTVLTNTFAKPTRGRIKQTKNLFKYPTKGTITVTDFLHSVKARADELAILGASMEKENLTQKILDGLGDDYKELVRVVQARDTSITFDELHEKLLSFEASLLTNSKSELKIIFLSMAYLTSPLHNIYLNTMATPKEDTAILLKLASPYFLMLLFQPPSGLMLLLLLST